jgi:hypothetical protein
MRICDAHLLPLSLHFSLSPEVRLHGSRRYKKPFGEPSCSLSPLARAEEGKGRPPGLQRIERNGSPGRALRGVGRDAGRRGGG